MIRVMHFADTHFGVETYGRLDPATGLPSRLLDFKQTLLHAIESGISKGAHLAVFAGDAYKGRDPSQTHQREFAECIRRLTENDIPVVMIPGNHDIPNVRGRAHAMEIYRTLDAYNVHIVSKPDLFVVETKGGSVQIATLPYLMKGFVMAKDESQGKTVEEIRDAIETKYQEYLEELAQRANPKIPTILIGHFWVKNARLSAWQQSYFNVNEPQVAIEHLARPEFDYVAMGHIHRHQDVNKGNYPPIVYSGSPDRIDFGEKEEQKGFVMVHLEREKTTYEFVELPNSRHFLDIDVSADTDTPTETIIEEIRRHSLRNAVVRLTYRIPAEKLPQVRESEIREALRPAFMLVSFRRDVLRDQTSRNQILTESLDPKSALHHYLDSSEKGRKRKEELEPYADMLFEELRKEESVQ